MALFLSYGIDFTKNEKSLRDQLNATLKRMAPEQLNKFSDRISRMVDTVNEVSRNEITSREHGIPHSGYMSTPISSTSTVGSLPTSAATTATLPATTATVEALPVALPPAPVTTGSTSSDSDIKVGDTVECGISKDVFVVSKIEESMTARYDPSKSKPITLLFSPTGARYQKDLCKKVSSPSPPTAPPVSTASAPTAPPAPTGIPNWNHLGLYRKGDRVMRMGDKYEYVSDTPGNELPGTGSSVKWDNTTKPPTKTIIPALWKKIKAKPGGKRNRTYRAKRHM